MRRKEREVTDRKQIEKVMELCSCCRIGFCDEGKIYIVPVNFGYEYGKDSCTIFFHGAQEGRKFELIKEEPEVRFEMDTSYQLKTADVACGYSSYFQKKNIHNSYIIEVFRKKASREKKMPPFFGFIHSALSPSVVKYPLGGRFCICIL